MLQQIQTAELQGVSHQTDCTVGQGPCCTERRTQPTEMMVVVQHWRSQLMTRKTNTHLIEKTCHNQHFLYKLSWVTSDLVSFISDHWSSSTRHQCAAVVLKHTVTITVANVALAYYTPLLPLFNNFMRNLVQSACPTDMQVSLWLLTNRC